MVQRSVYVSLSVFFLFLLASQFACAKKQSWSEFLKSVRQEAIAQGIRPNVLDRAFQGIKSPNRKVLYLDKTQPEKRLTFMQYRHTRADAYRIKLGRQAIKKHHALLQKVGHEYQVDPCFIVSLWGLETSYGRFMGSFPVIHALATLSYDNRRAAFFKKQLFLALHILNGEHVALEDFKGEWAGASGHPQFLPSSWHRFAVDYDNDGRKDIWKNLPDAFASIANYLHKNGWRMNEPWAIRVILPSHFNEKLFSTKVIKTVSAWKKLGLRGKFPKDDLLASVIHPYGGPAMMVFHNFKVIMRWNRSIYYAGTVGYMAEKICRRSL